MYPDRDERALRNFQGEGDRERFHADAIAGRCLSAAARSRRAGMDRWGEDRVMEWRGPPCRRSPSPPRQLPEIPVRRRRPQHPLHEQQLQGPHGRIFQRFLNRMNQMGLRQKTAEAKMPARIYFFLLIQTDIECWRTSTLWCSRRFLFPLRLAVLILCPRLNRLFKSLAAHSQFLNQAKMASKQEPWTTCPRFLPIPVQYGSVTKKMIRKAGIWTFTSLQVPVDWQWLAVNAKGRVCTLRVDPNMVLVQVVLLLIGSRRFFASNLDVPKTK